MVEVHLRLCEVSTVVEWFTSKSGLSGSLERGGGGERERERRGKEEERGRGEIKRKRGGGIIADITM